MWLKGLFIKKISEGEFQATIPGDALPIELQKEFGTSGDEELIVNGDFDIEFDDDLPLVSMTSISVTNGNRVIDINLFDKDGAVDFNDVYELESQLANSDAATNWNTNNIDEDAYYD